MDLSKFTGYPHITKVWGTEIVLHNSPLYCSKLLVIDDGMQCSRHKHLIKSESFITLEGKPEIQLGLGAKWIGWEEGDGCNVPVGTWHRFASPIGQSILLEISTTHSDDDVERLEPSGPIAPF